MGAEKIALGVWVPLAAGRVPNQVALGHALGTFKGIEEAGSNNHELMNTGAAALERSLRPQVPDDVGRILTNLSSMFEIQRQHGHQAKELHAGYNHFHLGAAVSGALAAHRLIESQPAARHLLDLCRGWMADRLAILRASRCPDGQILVWGTRCWVHEAIGQRIDQSARLAIMAQILDPMPLGVVTPWLRFLVPDSLAEPSGKHRDCSFGWHVPGSVNVAAIFKLLHRAIREGALPLDLIRAAAAGRRPRIAGEAYFWQVNDEHHAAVTRMYGLPFRGWHARWKSGRCETLLGEGYGDPDVRTGSGMKAAPRRPSIPAGLEPLFSQDLPIPPLPSAAPKRPRVHPAGWPDPGSRIPYRGAGGWPAGEIVMPEETFPDGDARWDLLSGLRKEPPGFPGGPGATAVYDELVDAGVIVPEGPRP